MANDPINAGAVIEVRHPFVRDTYTEQDNDGTYERPTWRPGTRAENIAPHGDTQEFADGDGAQILTVVATFKPGRFPERVFYTRMWRDPDGREFGKPRLHTKTTQAFRRLIAGFRFPYEVADGKSIAQG